MSPAKGETHQTTAVPAHRQDAPARPAPAGPQHTPTDGANAATAPAIPEVGCPTAEGQTVLYTGKTTASYFWDDGSGVNGDTGAPASGEPMQKGLAASPSWPMGTKGYVVYEGKKAEFFVGDRGPGVPSSSGVMLDLDGKTFADLTGGTWDTDSLTVEDAGGLGHIPVKYVITQWGKGLGKTGAPKPFSTGAYGVKDHPKPPPPCPTAAPTPSASPAAPQDSAPASTPGAKESPAPVAPSVTSPSAAPAAPDTQAGAAAAEMLPLPRVTDANAPADAAGKTTQKTAPKTAEATTAKAATQTVKGARAGEVTVSPAFTPASAVDGQLEEAAVPAFSVAIVVCALVAVGAKAALSRSAHTTPHDPGRHRK
ncbi:hypothetical protein ABZ860_10480 [Microbispora sp. NPDC046973]|uniref:hypothetical protein n=1 Tax=Microbispora sp. NPDC046973 TaxID=3155022 RepID=UPI0033FADFF0